MSNPRKPARDKPGSAKAANGKSANGKKTNGKKELKRKTVAAEIGATVMREETAAQMPSSAEREIGPAAAKPAMSRPARPAPKPATAKPVPVVAKPAPQPARPAPVASKPATPKLATPMPAKAPQQLLESAVDTIERSFKAAGEGTVAVNCKLLDFARINVNSSLDYVKDLAAARSPVRIMRLQIKFWHDCLETFASQAQELRALQAELVTNANEPLRRHMRGTQRAAGRPV